MTDDAKARTVKGCGEMLATALSEWGEGAGLLDHEGTRAVWCAALGGALAANKPVIDAVRLATEAVAHTLAVADWAREQRRANHPALPPPPSPPSYGR